MVATMNGMRQAAGGQQGADFTFAPWSDLPLFAAASLREECAPQVVVPGTDRFIALLMLVLLSPLMVLVALAIKITSPNAPVLYRQERVGIDRRRAQKSLGEIGLHQDRRSVPGLGKTFAIWKFRTMIPDAEKHSGPTWASQNDPRVTKLGRLLRHTRLDELPQLANVVAGHMCLIGPRPERPHFVQQLITAVPEYRRRLLVPPGITGLAQVERDYDASTDDVNTKVKYDLFYVENRSPLLDLKILIKTMDVVIRGKGAR